MTLDAASAERAVKLLAKAADPSVTDHEMRSFLAKVREIVSGDFSKIVLPATATSRADWHALFVQTDAERRRVTAQSNDLREQLQESKRKAVALTSQMIDWKCKAQNARDALATSTKKVETLQAMIDAQATKSPAELAADLARALAEQDQRDHDAEVRLRGEAMLREEVIGELDRLRARLAAGPSVGPGPKVEPTARTRPKTPRFDSLDQETVFEALTADYQVVSALEKAIGLSRNTIVKHLTALMGRDLVEMETDPKRYRMKGSQ